MSKDDLARLKKKSKPKLVKPASTSYTTYMKVLWSTIAEYKTYEDNLPHRQMDQA